jgi:hypothetical protein
MSFSGRKFSINRHTGVPKTFVRRNSISHEPGANGQSLICFPRHTVVSTRVQPSKVVEVQQALGPE